MSRTINLFSPMNVNRRNSKTTNLEKYSCLSWGSSSDERDPEMSKRLIKIEAGVWPDLVGQVRQTLSALADPLLVNIDCL